MARPAQDQCRWLRARPSQLCICAAAMTGPSYCRCATTTANREFCQSTPQPHRTPGMHTILQRSRYAGAMLDGLASRAGVCCSATNCACEQCLQPCVLQTQQVQCEAIRVKVSRVMQAGELCTAAPHIRRQCHSPCLEALGLCDKQLTWREASRGPTTTSAPNQHHTCQLATLRGRACRTSLRQDRAPAKHPNLPSAPLGRGHGLPSILHTILSHMQ